MSRARLISPARTLALLVAATLVGLAALLSLGAGSAAAAKPCWERVIDDWVDNGRIDGVYSPSCISAARKHVPEDIRAYTDIIDKIDSYRHTAGRSILISPGSPSGPQRETTPTKPGSGKEPEPNVELGRDEGPIPYVLGQGTTDASSIPLPLMILAGLALALMAAGGAGVARRKLQARRSSSGSS